MTSDEQSSASPTRDCSVYTRLSMPHVARAMTLQDFNPRSRTLGCCDRSYWQYKTITGFPAGTMQQLALPFVLLYSAPFRGNAYHGDEAMLERAVAAMQFWSACRHSDGALDEWYRNEYSYCATAFTTFGMSESLLLIRERFPAGEFDPFVASLRTTADWLRKRFNPSVMNQNLAACAALWNVYLLTDDQQYRAAFEEKWKNTLAHQHDEGWFREYGGADLGYSTLALDLLACLDHRGCESGILESAGKLARFMASFAVGTGPLASQLGSRGTQHAFPYGAEAFAGRIPHAAQVAAFLRDGYEADHLCTPASADDRYLAYFYLPQFMLVCARCDDKSRPTSEGASSEVHVWPESGFRIRNPNSSNLVLSLRRQGAFTLSSTPSPPHINMGWWAEFGDGRRASSSGWNEEAIDAEEGDASCRVRGNFTFVEDSLPLSGGSVGFHAMSEWVFCWPSMGERVQWWIKKRKIMRRRVAPLMFERLIGWQGDELVVSDTVSLHNNAPRLRSIGPVSTIDVHSPSANLGVARSQCAPMLEDQQPEKWAAHLNQAGILQVACTYRLSAIGVWKPPHMRQLVGEQGS